ncbi:hypothetical protein DRO42_04505 [Candidatus Bathyarchaeota archaeon]|nr:MAG: hypothetical protein DRO42_04505 [Candidatus Bathyarchaeota archaeon]
MDAHKRDEALTCLKSKIEFNTEALEKIVFEPEWVLKNQERFWEAYPAQRYTLDWAKQVKYEIDFEDWRNRIQGWSELTPEQRQSRLFLKNTRRIIEGRQRFIDKALPHLCSYLPEDADLGIRVYFTAFIPPRAFAMGEIVINVAATYWNDNPDNILNALVHELFHVGYSYCEEQSDRAYPEDDQRIGILRNIHNEGMCTYVAYKAREIFPAPDEKDFQYLDDPEQVREHLRNVDMILSKIGKVPREELDKLAWDRGVIGRSFYVAGARMCGVIEERLGRQALIQTMYDGPESFFELYNKNAEQPFLYS